MSNLRNKILIYFYYLQNTKNLKKKTKKCNSKNLTKTQFNYGTYSSNFTSLRDNYIK